MSRAYACILCHTPITHSVPEEEGYRICLTCDTTWSIEDEDPTDPTEEWEKGYYGRPNVVELHESRKSGMDAIVARLGTVYPDRGRLLDIGTGVGILMHAAAKDGWLVEGVEPSETAAERARKLTGAPVYEGLLEELTLSQESYDAVTIIDTLRQVPQPLAFLLSARRLVRPGGVLLIREVYRKFRRYYRHILGTSEGLKLKGPRRAYQHAQGFSPKSLLFALHAIGLEGSVEPSPIFVELESSGGLLSELSKRAVGLGSNALYKLSRHRIIFSPNLLAFGRAPIET